MTRKTSDQSVSKVLSIKKLSVERGGQRVLENINLDIELGDFVGLVGPNGGGKTSLILAILGILRPSNGTIKVFGETPRSPRTKGRIGWIPQAAAHLPKHLRVSVRELVGLGTLTFRDMFWPRNASHRERIERAIQLVGLQDVADQDVGRLSGGQRQRAVIAKGLASKAEFLLLDEPLVGVDRESRNEYLRFLDQLCHEENLTLLMVSHDLAAIHQSAHRSVYLEGSIRFDGKSENMPDLSGLANLRGIQPVHGPEHDGHAPHHHDLNLQQLEAE